MQKNNVNPIHSWSIYNTHSASPVYRHFGSEITLLIPNPKLEMTRMWADAHGDGRPAEYRWHPVRKFRNSIPCTMPQSLADARCWSAMQ